MPQLPPVRHQIRQDNDFSEGWCIGFLSGLGLALGVCALAGFGFLILS